MKPGVPSPAEVSTGHATSYDVARLARVSQSAVSRCFKPGASVSRKMRARVMKAAETLGYRPNAIARSLITRRSNMVAVVISQRGVPFVFYNRSLRDRPVNAVCCDQAEGARWLVNRLVDSGHKSFRIVSGPEDSVVSVERTQGAAGLKALQRKLGRLPDAVICANDVMAIGCMDVARHEMRLKVPADVSIEGFDGVGPARWQSYDLTIVQQPVQRMAAAAVQMIIERIENPKLPPEKRTFSAILVDGSSARLRRS